MSTVHTTHGRPEDRCRRIAGARGLGDGTDFPRRDERVYNAWYLGDPAAYDIPTPWKGRPTGDFVAFAELVDAAAFDPSIPAAEVAARAGWLLATTDAADCTRPANAMH